MLKKSVWRGIVLFCLVGCLLLATACAKDADEPTENTTQPSVVAGSPAPYNQPRSDLKTVRISFERLTDMPGRIDEIEQEFNRRLEEAGVSVRAKLVPFDSNEFFNTAGVLEDSMSEFDIIAADANIVDLAALVDAGYARDLTDSLHQYPDLLTMNSESAWEEATLNGRNYWIPLVSNPYVAQDLMTYFFVSESLLSILHAEFPRTLEDAKALLLEAKGMEMPYRLAYGPKLPPRALHREYAQWPFYVDPMSLFIYYADGSMEPYVESDVFLQDIAILQELSDQELLYVDTREPGPEGMTATALQTLRDAGLAMSLNEVTLFDLDMEYRYGLLEPEKPQPRIGKLGTSALFVTSSCADPEAAMEMIQAICTNDMVAITLVHGMEGEDWNMDEDGFFIGDLVSTSGRTVYRHYKNWLPHYPPDWPTLGEDPGVDYPYSGFRFYEYNPPRLMLSARMDSALYALEGLRSGRSPELTVEAVRQQMYDAGLAGLYREQKARYEEFLAQ